MRLDRENIFTRNQRVRGERNIELFRIIVIMQRKCGSIERDVASRRTRQVNPRNFLSVEIGHKSVFNVHPERQPFNRGGISDEKFPAEICGTVIPRHGRHNRGLVIKSVAVTEPGRARQPR